MSYDDDQDLINDLGVENHRLEGEVEKLKRLLRLPILFHQGGAWVSTAREEWESITDGKEATTKVMCDTIREGLA